MKDFIWWVVLSVLLITGLNVFTEYGLSRPCPTWIQTIGIILSIIGILAWFDYSIKMATKLINKQFKTKKK